MRSSKRHLKTLQRIRARAISASVARQASASCFRSHSKAAVGVPGRSSLVGIGGRSSEGTGLPQITISRVARSPAASSRQHERRRRQPSDRRSRSSARPSCALRGVPLKPRAARAPPRWAAPPALAAARSWCRRFLRPASHSVRQQLATVRCAQKHCCYVQVSVL